MSASKRSRPLTDGDEFIDVQASSSMAQGQSSKRMRFSLENELETSDRESRADDGSEDSGTETDPGNLSDAPPQTQYEILRDADFRHLKNLELDDVRATEKLKQRPLNANNGVVAQCGIIESITCYNFMCHERLHVEFGPLINFVVGENGSGKSAVLTALTLCLGGKASDTNRGGSLKSFVKEGRDQGQIVVKIKNAGNDAYQPEIYGESIIIERQFSKSGSSGFKIKNTENKTISTRKQEIDEISEWYSLQMNNPLTVLSQDNARQFLNSASPALKYKYFISGVQLEQLDNDYRMAQDTLDKTLILRDDLKENVDYKKKEMESAIRLSETALQNESLREKAMHHRSQLVWCQVVDKEKELRSIDEDIAKRATRITEAQQRCLDASTAFEEANNLLTNLKLAKEELDAECNVVMEKVTAAEVACTSSRKEVAELHSEEREAHSKLKVIQKEITSSQDEIEAEEKRLLESTGSARAETDARLKDAKRREDDIQLMIAESDKQLSSIHNKVRNAEDALKSQRKLKEVKQSDVATAERNLRALGESSKSLYDGFDRDVINLVKTIANDQGFETRPVGPIGAHVKLLKPEWSGILEKTFGESLNAFVVRSKQDQSRLSSIMRRTGMKRQPPIFIAYGGNLDTTSQEPSDGFDTILRILEFDDDVFRTQLIINGQIEKIILVKSRTEAEKIMVDGGGPPRNVAACLCFHDGKNKRGQGLRLTNRGGNIGTSPIVPTSLRPRMQSDSGRQLAVQKENLHQLRLELDEISAEEGLADQALKRTKSELASHNNTKKKLEVDLRHTQADIERIASDLDAFEGIDGRLNRLRTELKLKIQEKEQLGKQYGNLKLSKVDLNQKSEAAKSVLKEARSEYETMNERAEKANIKVKKATSARIAALGEKNQAFEQIDTERLGYEKAQERREGKVQEVADFTGQAHAAAPHRVHVPEGETMESIEKKYERIVKQLKQREQRQGASDEEIHDRAAEARKLYEEVAEQAEDVDRTIGTLKNSILYRLGLWRRFQRQISARIRIQFNYLLSERGFRGKIDLRHRERKVIIHIEPDETKKSSSGRDTKTLSGGEKSFSSICMLLSVWEAIGSPIRCLDEFDVFMDNVNRAISTNMLIDTAHRSVSRQYILITPNAIEGRAKLDKHVKIIRLTDPRQRTLV